MVVSIFRNSNLFIVLQVEAKDADAGRNGEISYQIISTHPHAEPPLLSIDPISGRLSLIRAVPSDWAGRRLIARVRATDGGQRFTDTEVTIQLAARLGPRFTSTHYAAVVAENAGIGESVTSVTAISASGTTLLYRILSIGPDHTESSVRESPFYLDYETGTFCELCGMGLLRFFEWNEEVIYASNRQKKSMSLCFFINLLFACCWPSECVGFGGMFTLMPVDRTEVEGGIHSFCLLTYVNVAVATVIINLQRQWRCSVYNGYRITIDSCSC